jgi:hypothetical protein
MNNVIKLGAVAILPAVVLGGCSTDPRDAAIVEEAAAVVAAKNPFAEAAPPRAGDEKLRGRIVELLRAGSYTYASVAAADGTTRWVVTMKRGLSLGDEVEVKNMGTQRGFRSKRLGRTFDELVFGVVRPASPTNGEG